MVQSSNHPIIQSSSLHLELVTPEKIAFSGEAEMVIVPGTEGDFGVLAGHAPFIATIRPGVIEIHSLTGSVTRLFIPGGVAEVNASGCTVLAEDLQDISSIAASDAQIKWQEAKAAFDVVQGDVEKAAAEKRLRYAEALLEVVSARH